jgi:hypothetical protein
MKTINLASVIAMAIIIILAPSCRTNRGLPQTTSSDMQNNSASRQAGPPVIVYKTTRNFSGNVAVTMNAQRTQIVAYPDPSDVGDFSRPTPLKNGYLLDNRGINEHVAFLRYTYDEYSRLSGPPSMADLSASVIEKYPLVEMIRCGTRYQYRNIVDEISTLIDSGFKGCERLKLAGAVILSPDSK